MFTIPERDGKISHLHQSKEIKYALMKDAEWRALCFTMMLCVAGTSGFHDVLVNIAVNFQKAQAETGSLECADKLLFNNMKLEK